MAKIKRTVEMNLWELIKYGWENDVKNLEIKQNGAELDFTETGRFDMSCSLTNVGKDDLFKIEIEEEITEETRLDLVDIYKDYGLPLEVAFCKNTSVQEILKLDKESKIDTKFIHIQNPDGSIGDLIWTKEKGRVE